MTERATTGRDGSNGGKEQLYCRCIDINGNDREGSDGKDC